MAPPIFRALELDAAIHAAKTEGKLLLVDFTADWCAPCKQMDKTTWVAPELLKWVDENAIAVQIDVENRPEDAKRFEVTSMPTLVLMRDSEVLDKTFGARPAAKVIAWAEDARAGRTELETTRATLRDDDPSGWLKYSMMLSSHGRHEEAFAQAERCWLHAVEVVPEWIGVKHSFLANGLRGFARSMPAAKAKIEAWRDDAARELTSEHKLSDWLTLCSVLGDTARVLEWFDSIRANPPELDLSRQMILVGLLRSHDRWADYGKLLRHPAQELARHAASFREEPPGSRLSDDQRRHLRAHLTKALRDEARAMLKALRAADRSDDAMAVEAKALELDPTDEMRDALATT